MNPQRFDAVVIGAGLAGALAARGLAQRGHSVLLVEKQRFPRPKVCGCCLNRYALTTLDQCGLGDLVDRLGARPLGQLRMIAGGRSAQVPLPRGVALSRHALDGALVRAAQSEGVCFRDNVSAKVEQLGESAAEGHRVTLGTGETMQASCLVIADGLGGSSLSKIDGFEVEATPASRMGIGGVTAPLGDVGQILAGTIEMACGHDGYLGKVQLEDGRLDFAAAIDARAIKTAGGLAEAASAIVEQAGADADRWPLDRVEQWRATPTLTRKRERLAAPGLFVVGDAAGYVEPFTGEGMAWAIAGGVALGPVAAKAVSGWHPNQELEWAQLHRRHIRRRQAGCRLVAATLRRPRLTRAVVRTLWTWPGLARPLVQRITAAHPDVSFSPASLRPAPEGKPV